MNQPDFSPKPEFELTSCTVCRGRGDEDCECCVGHGRVIRCRCGAARPWFRAEEFRKTTCVGRKNHGTVKYGF